MIAMMGRKRERTTNKELPEVELGLSIENRYVMFFITWYGPFSAKLYVMGLNDTNVCEGGEERTPVVIPSNELI